MHIYPLFLNTATTSHMPVWLPFPALTVPPPPFALRYCRRRRRDTTTHAPARRPRRAKPQRRGAAVERRPDGERVVYIKGCALVEPSSLPSSHRVCHRAIEAGIEPSRPPSSHRAIVPSSHQGLMPIADVVANVRHRAIEPLASSHRGSASRLGIEPHRGRAGLCVRLVFPVFWAPRRARASVFPCFASSGRSVLSCFRALADPPRTHHGAEGLRGVWDGKKVATRETSNQSVRRCARVEELNTGSMVPFVSTGDHGQPYSAPAEIATFSARFASCIRVRTPTNVSDDAVYRCHEEQSVRDRPACERDLSWPRVENF